MLYAANFSTLSLDTPVFPRPRPAAGDLPTLPVLGLPVLNATTQ